MITHFDATMAMWHRQIEMERLLQHQHMLTMRGAMPKQSLVRQAGASILALLGMGRTRSISPQSASQTS